MYPIQLPNDWFCSDLNRENIKTKSVINWITSESSLTVRIKELGIAFSVEVLSQTQGDIPPAIKHKLNCDDNSGMYREVLLKQGDTPLIYAQTIIPDSTISGTESMLAELGNQSLGQVLFQSPQAIRSNIEFTEVEKKSHLGEFIEQQLAQPITSPCYIRRSVFHLNQKPLLVNECFLPALVK